MRVFTLLYRNVKWRFHNAFTIIITLLQPLLWLILYSSAAKQTMQNTGIDFTGYLDLGQLWHLQQQRDDELLDEKGRQFLSDINCSDASWNHNIRPALGSGVMFLP